MNGRGYDPRWRPPQATPARGAFRTHRRAVRDGLVLAYLHEGQGGVPLLLLHGYPETKRIWWRNDGQLAEAGFEVIAPDLRGYGESDLSPGRRPDRLPARPVGGGRDVARPEWT